MDALIFKKQRTFIQMFSTGTWTRTWVNKKVKIHWKYVQTWLLLLFSTENHSTNIFSFHPLLDKWQRKKAKKIRGDTGLGRGNENKVHAWFPDCITCISYTADKLQQKEEYLAFLHTDSKNMVNFAFYRQKMIQESTKQEE